MSQRHRRLPFISVLGFVCPVYALTAPMRPEIITTVILTLQKFQLLAELMVCMLVHPFRPWREKIVKLFRLWKQGIGQFEPIPQQLHATEVCGGLVGPMLLVWIVEAPATPATEQAPAFGAVKEPHPPSAPVRFCSFSPKRKCRKMANKRVQPLNNYTCRFRPSSPRQADKSGLDGLQAHK